MISSTFDSKTTRATDYCWASHVHSPTKASEDKLAGWLAEAIVRERCGGSRKHFQAWFEKWSAGVPLPATSAEALPAFLSPVFGLQDGSVTVTDDHLEGFVSEHLWHQLVAHCPESEEIILLEPPSFHVTSPGGDGLAIHQLEDGAYMFRLWEVKKSTGATSTVSSTVSTAYSQLETRAAIYLAEYSRNGEERHRDKPLGEFYGQLVDYWLAATPQAAAGIAVATSAANMPASAFTNFGKRFERFRVPNRLRGMLTSLGDFPAFAKLVQVEVWKGL